MIVFFFQAALQEDLALDHNCCCGENSSDIQQPSSSQSHVRVSTNGPASRYSPTTQTNSSNRTHNDNSSSSSSSSPRQVKFIPLQSSPSSPSSPSSSSDSESDGEGVRGDDPLSGELEKLVGMKCCAPFSHDWGRLDYHNALVMSAVKEQDTDKILVSEILTFISCVCVSDLKNLSTPLKMSLSNPPFHDQGRR
jgi:hypothetical protein